MAKIPTTQVFQKGSVWMYSPALPPAIVFLILYFFAFVYITYLTFHRYKTWYLTVIPLGAFTEVAGYAVRIFSVKNQGNILPSTFLQPFSPLHIPSHIPQDEEKLTPKKKGAFIVTLTLHVLAPLLFAAGNYILLGRLIAHVLPPSRQTLLRIPRRYITRIFVGFDILAAAIQGSGTSIAAAAKWTGLKALAGVDVLVAGLAVQVAGVGLFLVVLGRFEVLVKGVGKGMKRGSWEGLLVAVWISSVLIFVSAMMVE
ncbi:hypothetical protein QBC40DRAFT_232433 [Triangularia verruculosa]|uniref:Uncharacterized protein n=1 Tax=Triangularia verruculosa TaxID=2587418 RepID=A0AAN6XAX6_9PEZI|nr:hypothetical protein QBC40DRAFT_232433 [Triangularia verruculosa]